MMINIEFITGLVFFLFGMSVIETGFGNLSEKRLSAKIESVGKNPIKGVLLGTAITAVLQSSSAVTVMLVGAVDAGIIKLKNSLGIIMGANIGTSVTAWIISLSGIKLSFFNIINPINLYPILGLAGIGFIILSKNINRYSIGMIMVGFTLIMSGMGSMSSAVEPLKNNEKFIGFLTGFNSPLLGIISGAAVTAVMQSSSASIGILQALSGTGSVTLNAAIPIILGQNIGTCITAGIAAVGAGKNAKRVAAFHLLFNVSGAVIWTVVFYLIRGFLPYCTIEAGDIALIHTLFNVTSTGIMLPIIQLTKIKSSFFIEA